MDSGLVSLLSVILLIAGFLGTFLPVLPGLVLSFCGLLLYKFGGNADIHIIYIYVFGALTLVSTIINYVIPAKANKKYGGTTWGSVGSFLGTIFGLMFIPVPFGFLIGMFLGVFIGELLHDRRDYSKALRSTKGAFIGFLYSTGFSMMVALAMFLVVVLDMTNII